MPFYKPDRTALCIVPNLSACRIRFELPENGDLERAAQLIINGNKLLHVRRLPEVAALLAAAQEQQRATAKPPTAEPSQPGPPLEARQQISAQDRQLLQAQQQRYLAAATSSATQVLAAAAATARLEHLENYLVSRPVGAQLIVNFLFAARCKMHTVSCCPRAAVVTATGHKGQLRSSNLLAGLMPRMLPSQEALYEDDLGTKTAAAAAVAQLFRDPSTLGVLQGHPALLQALARLLREDAKKSAELCISLLMVFFALSHLPSAHALLVQVGRWLGGRARHSSNLPCHGQVALHMAAVCQAHPLFPSCTSPPGLSPPAEPGGLPHHGAFRPGAAQGGALAGARGRGGGRGGRQAAGRRAAGPARGAPGGPAGAPGAAAVRGAQPAAQHGRGGWGGGGQDGEEGARGG